MAKKIAKKKTKKTKEPLVDFITVCPPGSFLIFNARNPLELTKALDKAAQLLDEKNIKGIILDSYTQVENLTDEELAQVGLYRFNQEGPRTDLLN